MSEHSNLHIEHVGGIPWNETPAPRRFRHKHRAQTTQWRTDIDSWAGDPEAINTCRCGATTHMWFCKWTEGHRFGGLLREKDAR